MSDFARLMEVALDAGIPVNPPGNLSVPAVTPPTAAAGDVLSCSTGTWNYPPDGYAYSWRHVGNPAELGAGTTYTTVQQDADTSVLCVVTATSDAGGTSVPSNAVMVSKKAAQSSATVTVSVSRDRK